MTPSIAMPGVTSVTVQRRPSRAAIWPRSQARSRVWQIAEVTTMNSCSASRVMVRSASMPPWSLSHWV